MLSKFLFSSAIIANPHFLSFIETCSIRATTSRFIHPLWSLILIRLPQPWVCTTS